MVVRWDRKGSQKEREGLSMRFRLAIFFILLPLLFLGVGCLANSQTPSSSDEKVGARDTSPKPRSRADLIAANEEEIAKALRHYAAAQLRFKVENLGEPLGLPHTYAETPQQVAEVGLIDPAFAAATSPHHPYAGYTLLWLQPSQKYWFELFAIPVRYGKTGIRTFYINQRGKLFAKDLHGLRPEGEPSEATGWTLLPSPWEPRPSSSPSQK